MQVYKYDFNSYLNQHICKIKIKDESIDNKYLYNIINNILIYKFNKDKSNPYL